LNWRSSDVGHPRISRSHESGVAEVTHDRGFGVG
jgi:hypothetical protein